MTEKDRSTHFQDEEYANRGSVSDFFVHSLLINFLLTACDLPSQLSKPIKREFEPVPGLETDFITVYKTH